MGRQVGELQCLCLEWRIPAEDIEALRIKYLSKKGEISNLMNDFRNVAAEQKRELGQRLNALKQAATDKINALKEQYQGEDHIDESIDLTRPAYPEEVGTRHPLSLVRQQIVDIFARLGFSIRKVSPYLRSFSSSHNEDLLLICALDVNRFSYQLFQSLRENVLHLRHRGWVLGTLSWR